MARVAFIFLFAYCVFHLSAGAPIDVDPAAQTVEQGIKNLQSFFETTFTQENINKMQNSLKELGAKLGEQGKVLMNKAGEELNKLKEKEQVRV